jgi:hypothetical protein
MEKKVSEQTKIYAYIHGFQTVTNFSINEYVIMPISFDIIEPLDQDWIIEDRYCSFQRVFITREFSTNIISREEVIDDLYDLFCIIEATTGTIGCSPLKGVLYIVNGETVTRKIGEIGRTLLISKYINHTIELIKYIQNIETNYYLLKREQDLSRKKIIAY